MSEKSTYSASDYLFPEYLREDTILATHAGNTLNKWMKQHFGGKTAHCLRHAFRDRLRAVECPLELLDALGGSLVVDSLDQTGIALLTYICEDIGRFIELNKLKIHFKVCLAAIKSKG